MKPAYVACAFLVCAAALGDETGPAPSLQDVVKRLDQAASQFKGMTAKISRTEHTAVLNEDDTESGVVYMKKTGGRLQALMDITQPDKKVSALEGREVQIYYPNMKQVDIYDAGKNGEQLEEFLTLGFGTSGSDLQRMYTMKVKGVETVKNENTVHLELIPKSDEAKKMVSKIDLWIGEHNYPVQEKIYEPSGNYNLVSYNDVQINPPNLKEQDVQLKLPDGVKKNYPQKQ